MATASRNGQVVLNPVEVDIEDLTGDDVFTTQKGFKLRILPIAPDLILEARRRVPEPKPPMIPVEGEPGKFDEHYGHPDYVKAKDHYNEVIHQLTFQVMAAYGVAAYAIPTGAVGPESDAWIDALEDEEVYEVDGENYAIKIPRDKKRARFAAWLKNYVISQEDGPLLNDAFMRGAGAVLEKDVDDAVESFPGSGGRRSDSGDVPAEPEES